MNLLRRLTGGEERADALSLDQWAEWFKFNGLNYTGLNQTLTSDQEDIPSNFEGYVNQAYKANGPIFAIMLVRQSIFSETRFAYRRELEGRPAELFSDRRLRTLEKPWVGGTTGDLLSRAIQDADLAGNHYAHRTTDLNGQPRIRRLRPDWVTIVLGSNQDPDDAGWALDAEVVGYIYHPGGPNNRRKDPIALAAEEVAHFAPIPDPIANYRGMSWLTPVIREIAGDKAMTVHKNKFLENGATPNLVVQLDSKIGKDAFDRWVEAFEDQHKGYLNAYKTLYLGGGADVTPVGADFKEIEFKAVQGSGETRLAAAGGVSPVIVGFSEGLQGSSLNAGNYGQARRRLADGTMRPLWRNIAGSYATLVEEPDDAHLWYDDRDISFLQEDLKDTAEIQHQHARTITRLSDGGFDPDSVIEAVTSGDFTRLKHTGLHSVQLHPADPDEPPDDPDQDDDDD